MRQAEAQGREPLQVGCYLRQARLFDQFRHLHASPAGRSPTPRSRAAAVEKVLTMPETARPHLPAARAGGKELGGAEALFVLGELVEELVNVRHGAILQDLYQTPNPRASSWSSAFLGSRHSTVSELLRTL